MEVAPIMSEETEIFLVLLHPAKQGLYLLNFHGERSGESESESEWESQITTYSAHLFGYGLWPMAYCWHQLFLGYENTAGKHGDFGLACIACSNLTSFD